MHINDGSNSGNSGFFSNLFRRAGLGVSLLSSVSGSVVEFMSLQLLSKTHSAYTIVVSSLGAVFILCTDTAVYLFSEAPKDLASVGKKIDRSSCRNNEELTPLNNRDDIENSGLNHCSSYTSTLLRVAAGGIAASKTALDSVAKYNLVKSLGEKAQLKNTFVPKSLVVPIAVIQSISNGTIELILMNSFLQQGVNDISKKLTCTSPGGYHNLENENNTDIEIGFFEKLVPKIGLGFRIFSSITGGYVVYCAIKLTVGEDKSVVLGIAGSGLLVITNLAIFLYSPSRSNLATLGRKIDKNHYVRRYVCCKTQENIDRIEDNHIPENSNNLKHNALIFAAGAIVFCEATLDFISKFQEVNALAESASKGDETSLLFNPKIIFCVALLQAITGSASEFIVNNSFMQEAVSALARKFSWITENDDISNESSEIVDDDNDNVHNAF